MERTGPGAGRDDDPDPLVFAAVLVVQYRTRQYVPGIALHIAVGDLVDETFGPCHSPAALIIAVIIGAVAQRHVGYLANAVLTFRIAYVLTRLLGASLGDGFAQAHSDGGLGRGTRWTRWTSALFFLTILAVVLYLAVSRCGQEVVLRAESPAGALPA